MKDYELLDANGRATPLTNFLGAHRGYRRDAARFPQGVRNLASRDFPAEGLDALRSHWVGYDKLLLVHHEMEDSFLFPMYRAQQPSLGSVIDELETQHHHLDELIADINGWLAKLPSPDAVEPAVAVFEAFEAAVNQHLDLEEQHIVPLMLAAPPVPPQYAEPDADADAPVAPQGPPADMDFAFIGPWLADGLDETTVAALLVASPPPFTADFDGKRRHYEAQLALWSS